MNLITAITLVILSVMFIAPEYEAPQGALTREDKIQILCGQNAGWIETKKPGEIQCFTKRGHKTTKKIIP